MTWGWIFGFSEWHIYVHVYIIEMRDKKNIYKFVTVITVFIMAFFYYLFDDAN